MCVSIYVYIFFKNRKYEAEVNPNVWSGNSII